MAPNCPRCGLPLDPMDTRPSRSGAVHPGCVRLEDSTPPEHVDSIERLAPKYGGPPTLRYGCSLVLIFAIVASIILLRRL